MRADTPQPVDIVSEAHAVRRQDGEVANRLERQSRGRWTWPQVGLMVLAGFVVLVLLFPASEIDTQPPECYSVFGYVVPCEAGWAIAAGVLAAAVVAGGMWIVARQKSGA